MKILCSRFLKRLWSFKMDELVRITECVNVKDNGQTIILIFYHVNPSDVRKQTGSFQEAFVNHEKQNEG